MTTITRRSPAQILQDIARYEDWQTVPTVQAGAAFAAWVERRLTAAKQELTESNRSAR